MGCKDAIGLSHRHTASGEETTLSFVWDWLEHPSQCLPLLQGCWELERCWEREEDSSCPCCRNAEDMAEELGCKWLLTSLLTSIHPIMSCLCRDYKKIKEIVIVIFMALPVPDPSAHPGTGQAPATTQPAMGNNHIQCSATHCDQELDMHPLCALV